MRFRAQEIIDRMVEGYRASLEDDGGFVESEFNSQVGADLFEYDTDTDELVLVEAEVRKTPHIRVEYDLAYYGGDYSGVGQFVLIPEGLTFAFSGVEEAFEKVTGYNRRHMVHYSTDERFDADGMEFLE